MIIETVSYNKKRYSFSSARKKYSNSTHAVGLGVKMAKLFLVGKVFPYYYCNCCKLIDCILRWTWHRVSSGYKITFSKMVTLPQNKERIVHVYFECLFMSVFVESIQTVSSESVLAKAH